ncbi:Holliday junction branch migration protein RuvA [Neomicrococcus aestuarii]|uniref:Holliday junction branch migration complex subunit RuvA n=1 Tax=Neomicrococcus aestuarii TaxID=556325 RepID=A0A1L2ZRJ9_9MICC|nr:Holliday junction branch migration protein RuvA [Neomicrococcus aestuarii]APF41652.1 Holliday junction DNA helicase RuvA [Neomicrococcus aestuarii]
MIATLTGTVTHVGLSHVVIDVNGFGMLVHSVPSTLAALTVGEVATLHTHMVVREDSMNLYGFADGGSRDVFEVLISVSGVGPRIGLAILAVHSAEAVRIATTTKDVTAFTKVPGIGPKGAQRIVLELAGKLAPTGEDEGIVPVVVGENPWEPQVTEALVGLGWSEKDAKRMLAKFPETEPEIAERGSVPEILRAVLRTLGNSATGRN